ncbi:MAG TPA: hypothetical protein VMU57_20845 [Edaphobacter sp.]|uniref:hypothetical protein n=1 Tax=Edaphobacter sp. TaxID=1934404 RepID=UPI002CE581A8|nr:hypothetical protein [Edaphobacter sp.]HUZ97359.1 hypothetical protein [Edaphobacter sp.]
MVTFSEHPKTLDEIQASIRKHLGDPGAKKPSYSFDRPSKTSNLLCFVSHATSDVRYEIEPDLLQIVAKSWRLHLNLESFFVRTEFAKDKFCLWIESHPDADHRHFTTVLRELTTTKHPAFYSRVLRAFRRLENDLPSTLIDDATAAPSDYLVAVEALTSASETTQLIVEDPFIAAKFRGLKRKQQMLETAGGALTSEQVAEVLGISRQAVDKRRAATQLLALTQGRRGYSYPSFQFEDGRPITGLEEVLAELKELDPWMQMVFFTSPNERLGDKTPLERLKKGLVSEVKAAATGFGEQGAA